MNRRACVLALDVGGTTIKAGIADLHGTFFHRTRRPTRRADGVDVVVANLLAVSEDLARTAEALDHEVVAAGVVVPGVVDEDRGVAVDSSNIGWRDVPLRTLLRQRLDVPVYLGHDVRGGALAEARRGAATGRRNFVFLPIGTGIGAALVIDGHPYSGANYAAAEVGHIVVRRDGDPCVCGGVGCLETLASASAIARRHSDLTGRPDEGAVAVAARVRAGEAAAVRVWDEAVDALADALTTVGTLFDPEVIVIGGGLGGAGPLLSAPLRDGLAKRAHSRTSPQLAHALLGDEAGCVGAALFALDLIHSS